MNNRLKIYACSGIGASGAGSIEERLDYELEGSRTLENTQAMNMLLSHINYLRSRYLYGGEQNADVLNEMDKYAVCYWYAKKYRNDDAMLEKVGYNIGIAVEDGEFESSSTTLSAHEERVDRIIERVENEAGDAKGANSGFIHWWYEYVLPMNVDAASKQDQQLFADTIAQAVAGVGATDKYGIESDSDLSKFLNDSGSYFTYYMCISLDEAKRISAKAARKWRKQKEVYDYCAKCFIGFYGTEESMKRIIETGIVETYERSMDKVHDQIISGEAYHTEKVGIVLTADAIASIITAIAAVIAALITGLCQYAKAKVQAKYTVPADTDSAILSEDDYTGSTTTTTASLGNTKTLLLFAGAATVGYFMFGEKF